MKLFLHTSPNNCDSQPQNLIFSFSLSLSFFLLPSSLSFFFFFFLTVGSWCLWLLKHLQDEGKIGEGDLGVKEKKKENKLSHSSPLIDFLFGLC